MTARKHPEHLICLHFRNGMNTNEIAKYMNLPEYEVESLLHIARASKPNKRLWPR